MDAIIYGIGGGKMSDPRMADHYTRIVDLAQEQFGIKKPRLAVLPTAHYNGTHPKIGRGYMDFAVERFRGLGCAIQSIMIGAVPAGQTETSDEAIRDILGDSHAVFVLGGDTRYLLEVVRAKGLAPAIASAVHDGKVMAGTSAGFIWLAEHCMSDAESFHADAWRYIMLQGLGILPIAANAHDNGPIPHGLIPQVSRRTQFEGRFAGLGEVPGIAVDEFAAIEVRNFVCRTHCADKSIGAYVLANGANGIARRKIGTATTLDLRNQAQLRDYARS